MATSDDELMRSFVQLYALHENRLHGLALSLFPRLDDANELMQETALILWQKFGQFRLGTSFFAWGSKIMQLKAKDLRRSRFRHGFQLSEEACEQLTTDAAKLSDSLIDREVALHQCIKLMPDKHLQLLTLRYENGSTINGIARAIGRTEGSVRQTLTRIRKMLADCIQRHMTIGVSQ